MLHTGYLAVAPSWSPRACALAAVTVVFENACAVSRKALAEAGEARMLVSANSHF